MSVGYDQHRGVDQFYEPFFAHTTCPYTFWMRDQTQNKEWHDIKLEDGRIIRALTIDTIKIAYPKAAILPDAQA